MDLHTSLSQAILDNIPDQAWLKDCESRYVAVNEAFALDCGWAMRDIIGRTPKDVWPSEWGDIYLRTDREVIVKQTRQRYEETRLARDGRQLWFDTIKTPIRNERGEIVGTAGISRDITDRKNAEQALQRINRLYALRSAVSHAIVHARDEADLFARVCRSFAEWGEWALAWAGRISPDAVAAPGPVAVRAAQAGLQRRCAQTLQPGAAVLAELRPPRAGVQARALDAASGGCHDSWALELGCGGLVTLSVRQGGRPAAALFLYSQAPGPLLPDLRELLASLARDLSHALDALHESVRRVEAEIELRRLSAFLQQVREEERKRISRELHDELGQSLTALQIGLGVLLDPARQAALDRQRHIRSLHDLAERTVHTVQRIASELRPPMLDGLGLVPAIEWLIETLAAQSPIRFVFEAAELPSLDEPRSTALFRIAQEALTNICRHSEAHNARVQLVAQGTAVLLSVSDDGRGFEPVPRDGRRMLGLIGMRERVQDLGGTLRIDSSPGQGTRVEARLPAPPRGRA